MAGKGGVVLYYIVHAGRGALGPSFKRELKRADVLNIESTAPVGRLIEKKYNAAAVGDKKTYDELLNLHKEMYAFTGDRSHLMHVQLLQALFGSGKKVVFEKPRAKPVEYPESLSTKTYNKLVMDIAANVAERARDDSRRIASEMGKKPGQKLLVLRGVLHYMTTPMLKRALEDRRVNAGVRAVPPPARRAVMGTPYHASLESRLLFKRLAGRRITKGEFRRVQLADALGEYLASRGWKGYDIDAQLGHLVNALSLTEKEQKQVMENAEGARSFFMKRGINVEKPWWTHEKDILKKKPGLKKR